jgi:hypothetical protein
MRKDKVNYFLSIKYRRNRTIFWALAYTSFVLFFPWEMIKKDSFGDYLIMYEKLSDFNEFTWYIDGKLNVSNYWSYLSNELMWAGIIYVAYHTLSDPTLILRILSAIILFSSSFYLFRRHNVLIPLVLLLNPYFIDLVLSQVRSALAWLIIFYGYYHGKNKTFYILAVISFFIHISVILLPLMLIIKKIISSLRFNAKHFTISTSIFISSLLFFIIIIFGSQIVLNMMSDARSNIRSSSLSYAQMAPFLIFLMLQLSSNKTYQISNSSIITMLCSVSLICLSSAYFSRLRFILYPLLIHSGMNLSVVKRRIFISTFICFEVASYMYWTKIFYVWY